MKMLPDTNTYIFGLAPEFSKEISTDKDSLGRGIIHVLENRPLSILGAKHFNSLVMLSNYFD